MGRKSNEVDSVLGAHRQSDGDEVMHPTQRVSAEDEMHTCVHISIADIRARRACAHGTDTLKAAVTRVEREN